MPCWMGCHLLLRKQSCSMCTVRTQQVTHCNETVRLPASSTS
jgi:hypothetical protein